MAALCQPIILLRLPEPIRMRTLVANTRLLFHGEPVRCFLAAPRCKLSAPIGGDVLIETPGCNFRPTLGLDGLVS
jgi:hypothetical protein